MKFQVQYPNGPVHEVELQGTVAILGRDPSCDLVLNDIKCSRRHAVVEAGPQGLAIRDTGSANGVFLNGKKVDRAPLNEGDIVRLGDALLTVLPEDIPGTLVMGPDELQEATALGGPKPSRRPAPPAASAGPPAPKIEQRKTETVPPSPRPVIPPRADTRAHRPLTLTVLAILWMISVVLYPAVGLATARVQGGTAAIMAVIAGLALAVLSGGMAFGLWARQRWARVAQITIAALGLLLCPFTLASAAVLAYMLRPATAAQFSRGRHAPEPLRPDAADLTFTGVIVALVVVGIVVAAGAAFFLRASATSLPPR